MNKICPWLFITFSLLFIHLANAQSTSTPAAEQKATAIDSADKSESKRSLLLEFDYGTNRGYQLRRKLSASDTTQSSLNQKYISPNINYEAKSGFFSSVTLFKTPGAKAKWDELLFGIGWDFKLSKRADVDASIGYTNLIYNQTKKQNGNPPASELTAYVKHDFKVVEIKVTGDYYFGGTTDEDIIIDIDHEFYIDNLLSKKDELSIDPMFTIIGASLNYYKDIIPIPKDKAERGIINSTLNNVSQFRFNDYEFSLPVNYQIGKFDFEIAWRYNIPLNQLPADIPAALADKLSPFLSPKSYSYITALVSYDFLK